MKKVVMTFEQRISDTNFDVYDKNGKRIIENGKLVDENSSSIDRKDKLMVSDKQFNVAHEAFKDYLFSKTGLPFLNWGHPYLIKHEISCKYAIYYNAHRVLQLDKWKQWIKIPGRIIASVKSACLPGISSYLLEHRFGLQQSSELPLYKVKGVKQIGELEMRLFNLFSNRSKSLMEFGKHFDLLADYLRENSLGCKWPFLAYLAFLADSQRFFPILPSSFEALLHYYGCDERISGYVLWGRYRLLLDLAAELKDRLIVYGSASAIEIQSYMWVVSSLLDDMKSFNPPKSRQPDFADELDNRTRRSCERERIGFSGEIYVYEMEHAKLKKAHRLDLARKVRLISMDGDTLGYDLISFHPNGQEFHIEVKTTTRSKENDIGFWMSENEKVIAESDDNWVIYRVWDIDSKPSHLNIGNILQDKKTSWKLSPSGWFVSQRE